MSGGRIEEALRVKPKEKNAKCIHIDCLEIPGEHDQYKVCVTPKQPSDEPGKKQKWQGITPYERLFEGKDAEERVLAYVKQVL